MPHELFAIAAGNEFRRQRDARKIGIETGNQAGALHRGRDEIKPEGSGVDIDGDPPAASYRIGNGDGFMGCGPERILMLAETWAGKILCLCLGQMMPLLIAVATAMARLLAENFRIAWVM